MRLNSSFSIVCSRYQTVTPPQLTHKFEYEENNTCICGNGKLDSGIYVNKIFTWGTIRFVQCQTCGSWSQSPQITLESLKKWLDSPDYQGSIDKKGVAYINYIDDEPSRREEAKGRYQQDLVNDLPRGAKVLEIGCATGTLLSILRDHGCETTGIDLSPKFTDAAKKIYGIDVLLGDVKEFNLPHRHFDAVLLLGTIGNLRFLPAYLEQFRKLLKKEGKLIFNFADSESPMVKYFYKERFWMFTPSVNCFMSLRGCKMALENSGFQITTLHRDRQRPSLRKIANHAQLNRAMSVLKALKLDKSFFPFSIPLPSIKFVKANIVL